MRKLKQFFTLLLLIFVSFTLSAVEKTTLSGRVTDKITGEGLPFVEVFLPDLKTGTLTKADGTYFIDNLPTIKTLVQVRAVGYTMVTEMIDLSVTVQKDFSMEQSVLEMREVTITGTSHATETRRNPVPITIVSHDYLLHNSGTNVIDAIGKIPGISAVSTGPNLSKPYIRGLGFNRVLTLYDGVRQDGQQWGEEHGIEVDPYLVYRIEVVKGPASLIYGSDALAGVVNLLPENPVHDSTIRGSMLAEYQSNNKMIGNSVSLATNRGGFAWGIRFSHRQAADYQNRFDGRVYGTKFNERSMNLYAGLNRSWGYSYLNFTLYDNIQEVPDGSRDSLTRKFTKQVTEEDTLRMIVSDDELGSYTIAVIHQRVQHYRLYSSSNFILGKSKLAVKIAWQQSHRREFGHVILPDLPALNLILNTYSYDVKFQLPERENFESAIGFNGFYQVNRNGKATEFIIPDYTSLDFGPFIYVKRSFGKFDIAAGMRYDVRIFSNDDLYTRFDPVTGFEQQATFAGNDSGLTKQFDAYAHTFSGISGSLGGTYNLSEGFFIKMNVARGYRAPNVSEISAKGVHPGTGFQQLGDANFKPEFSLQEDLGIFFATEHISGSVEIFNNLLTNYIYNEKLQGVNGEDSVFVQGNESFEVFKFRQTNAQLFGGEFSLDIHPHPLDWLHIENSVSVIYAKNLGGNGAVISDSTKYLPFIPPFHTNTELRADFGRNVGFLDGIFMRVNMEYYGAQERIFSAYGTETTTPGYVLFGAAFGTRVINREKETVFTLDIIISNLTNTGYQSNMSRLKYMDDYPQNYTGRSGIYNMGRNVCFKVSIPIDGKL
jgi:iron complex outermembrane recepter protein